MIVDCHAHIRNADDSHLRDILVAADRAGVDKLCISSLGREWTEFPDEARLEEAADDVLAAVDRYPGRFIGYTYVSADWVEKSLELMDRTIAEGPCRIIKLWVSQLADDPRLDDIYARAIDLAVPVMAHSWIKATGNMTKESTCHNVVNAAARHPDLRIWFAHYSGRWEEAARVMRDQPNVAVDICGGEPEDGIVECLLQHVGPDRIFYGSDIPGRSLVVQMAKVLSADISDDAKTLILGEAVRRWIRD